MTVHDFHLVVARQEIPAQKTSPQHSHLCLWPQCCATELEAAVHIVSILKKDIKLREVKWFSQ